MGNKTGKGIKKAYSTVSDTFSTASSTVKKNTGIDIGGVSGITNPGAQNGAIFDSGMTDIVYDPDNLGKIITSDLGATLACMVSMGLICPSPDNPPNKNQQMLIIIMFVVIGIIILVIISSLFGQSSEDKMLEMMMMQQMMEDM